MAVIIPALSSCKRRMNSGERRLGERLEQKLEDDYVIWYEPSIGPKMLRPDFLVLHPRRGILVLEVKDWKLSTIKRVDKYSVQLLTNTGLKTVGNPLEQARTYACALVNLLERDPALIQAQGAHQGKLAFPWSYGVVLSHITRKQFTEAGMAEVIAENRVICSDEMVESVDAEAFQQRLWSMFAWQFHSALTLPQIDRVRWHLFPEIRIGDQRDLFAEDSEQVEIPDVLKLMDIQQEQLARSLGEGHRVIHGVAGSGKTMILGYRAEYLAKTLTQPILVLCYNRVLADKLKQIIVSKGFEHKVSVRSFLAWCREQLLTYNVSLPPDNNNQHFYDELVQRVIDGVEREQIPAGQYGAVLIDEGHDFQAHWLKLVAQMVSPETNALLLLYDDAQNIYGKNSRKQKFSFKSVGIQAAGRTTILRLNYRNTAEIIAFAYDFAKDVLKPADMDDDDSVPLIMPQASARSGRQPEVIKLPMLGQRLKVIAERFKQLKEQGFIYSDMAFIYRTIAQAEQAATFFAREGIAVKWLKSANAKQQAKQTSDAVNFVTMHSSKGLEFPVVALSNLPNLEKIAPEKHEEEVKLAYVAMTRGMEVLIC